MIEITLDVDIIHRLTNRHKLFIVNLFIAQDSVLTLFCLQSLSVLSGSWNLIQQTAFSSAESDTILWIFVQKINWIEIEMKAS